MKPRFRPFSNLYFQFIQGTDLDGKIQWNEAASVLHRAGFIELIPDKTGAPAFSGYKETEALRKAADYRLIVTAELRKAVKP